MLIHVVEPGETVSSIANTYGVSVQSVIADNDLREPYLLAVGQTLVIQFPQEIYVVKQGQTLSEIAWLSGQSLNQLYRNNPALHALPDIRPGQRLVLSYHQEKEGSLMVTGYAYPYINQELLRQTLPYLTYLIPFTYGFTPQGELVKPDDAEIVQLGLSYDVASLFHFSTLTEEGDFSSELSHLLLNDPDLQNVILEKILQEIVAKGYRGLDFDFEYVFAEDRDAYSAFVAKASTLLNPLGYLVFVALAPKTADDQNSLLYVGQDFAALGQAANYVFLMTYEWGYAFGPPMAVAPLPEVRRAVDYAMSRIPAEKIILGIPNYGYDWRLPYSPGQQAFSLSNVAAIQRAIQHGAIIQYDENAQAPYFYYNDSDGIQHIVWFEDARSIRAKLALANEYHLVGVGYWNLYRPFPQNWRVLNALYDIPQSL